MRFLPILAKVYGCIAWKGTLRGLQRANRQILHNNAKEPVHYTSEYQPFLKPTFEECQIRYRDCHVRPKMARVGADMGKSEIGYACVVI